MSLMASSFPLAPSPFTTDTKNDPSARFTFPSPPPSIHSDAGLDFDLESFAHTSPESARLLETLSSDGNLSFDLDLNVPLDLSPIASQGTPASTTIISPRSSIVDVAANITQPPFTSSTGETDTAEALSNHHLQRYLHYKALAAKAEADRAVTQQSSNEFGALFAACEKPDSFMPAGDASTNLYKDYNVSFAQNNDNMLAYQSQPQLPSPSPYYGIGQPQVATWSQPPTFTYHPQSSQAALHHAQAQAHLQAADAARMQVQQSRPMSMSSYYLPTSERSSFDASQQPLNMYQRQSASTTVSGHSPPYPSTPTYPGVPSLVPHQMVKTSSVPSFASIDQDHILRRTHSHQDSEGEGEDELADYSPKHRDYDEVKPMIPGMPIPNAHGGGRGYVPGQTPDDPRKRHKCQICGRGFARAFNLKSHVQTHNPARPKPYQCPHTSCKRGFSRLHDLERHRQGIHSDGPLVDAKRQGVAPAVARAQGRMQKRAETGSLI